MEKWAYEKVVEGESINFHVVEIGDDGTVETAYKAANETRLKHLLNALRWYDSFSMGIVKEPKTPSFEYEIVFEPPPKPRAKSSPKTKKRGA